MTSDLDVGRLRLLREVALRGSIAAAAREVGLTPSAVSQQLAALEREAGTALVDRSPRGVRLTGAGHALAARAGEVLDVLASARAALARLGGVVGGPGLLASVASADGVQVTAREVPPLVLVRPGQHVEGAAAGSMDPTAPAQLADLADLDWVMPPEDAACGLAVRSACRSAGFEPRVRWISDDMLVLVSAVAAGHGVAVLPRLSVPSVGLPVTVTTLRTPALERRLLAVARTAALARPAVAVVLETLRNHASPTSAAAEVARA